LRDRRHRGELPGRGALGILIEALEVGRAEP